MTEHIETHRASQHPVDIAQDYLIQPFREGRISNGDMEGIIHEMEKALKKENGGA